MTIQRVFSYRHRDAKVGLTAPLECPDMYIFMTPSAARDFALANLRDPQDYVILAGPVESIGNGRSRLMPDAVSEVAVTHG